MDLSCIDPPYRVLNYFFKSLKQIIIIIYLLNFTSGPPNLIEGCCPRFGLGSYVTKSVFLPRINQTEILLKRPRLVIG